jgi:hypothetical protein
VGLPSFDDCRERIERARMHGKSATDIWTSLRHEDFYTGGIEQQGDRILGFWAQKICDFPASISLSPGEMLYQLRAALDGAIYAVVCQEAGAQPEDEGVR